MGTWSVSDFWTDRRVLITGGLGFIGSHVAAELVARGSRVTILDLASGICGGNPANVDAIRNQVAIVDGDLRDAGVLEHVLPDQEVIFCTAGQVSHPDSMNDPLKDLDVNCRAYLQLLEISRRVCNRVRIVFTSTRQLYGRPITLPVDETHPVRPVDVNGVSKLAAENFFRLYWDVYGMPSVSLRLTNTYGPRMDLTTAGRGFVNVCLAQALRQEEITLWGSGDQLRDFNYVDDVVEAMLLAAICESAWGGSFNLSHPHPCSLREFVETLGRCIPVKYRVIPFPPERRAIDVGDYFGCSERYRSLTGWAPKWELAAGLLRTVESFQLQADGEVGAPESQLAVSGRMAT